MMTKQLTKLNFCSTYCDLEVENKFNINVTPFIIRFKSHKFTRRNIKRFVTLYKVFDCIKLVKLK